jgi:hypothetical protein
MHSSSSLAKWTTSSTGARLHTSFTSRSRVCLPAVPRESTNPTPAPARVSDDPERDARWERRARSICGVHTGGKSHGDQGRESRQGRQSGSHAINARFARCLVPPTTSAPAAVRELGQSVLAERRPTVVSARQAWRSVRSSSASRSASAVAMPAQSHILPCGGRR